MLKVAKLSKATYMRWIKRLNEKDKDYEIKEKNDTNKTRKSKLWI